MCKSYTCEYTTIYVRRTIFTHLNIQLFKLHVKSFYYLKEKTCKNVDLQHNLKNGQHFFLTFLMTVLVSQFRSIWSFPIKKSRSPINVPPSFFIKLTKLPSLYSIFFLYPLIILTVIEPQPPATFASSYHGWWTHFEHMKPSFFRAYWFAAKRFLATNPTS